PNGGRNGGLGGGPKGGRNGGLGGGSNGGLEGGPGGTQGLHGGQKGPTQGRQMPQGCCHWAE
ncbi:MAG: hypothetical protein Q4F29_14360, partial [Lachnospiraceae bacterium]|nr:hypothetical protein [Lachnospiraceae bacterium]